MSNRTLALDERIYAYLLAVSLREPEILRRLRTETAGLKEAGMQIAPEQGQLMAFLVRLMGAVRVLEIGTFTGYSALAMGLALPPEGRLVACDINEQWTSVARRYWAEAGIADRIELRLAPALETLEKMVREGAAGSFDFAFVDADKERYRAYYEWSLRLVRLGGLIAIDNTLWDGRVADPSHHDADTAAIRAFNAFVATDDRVDLSLVPIGDGLTLARRIR